MPRQKIPLDTSKADPQKAVEWDAQEGGLQSPLSQLHCLLTVSWDKFLKSLCLSFLICNMGMIIVPTS